METPSNDPFQMPEIRRELDELFRLYSLEERYWNVYTEMMPSPLAPIDSMIERILIQIQGLESMEQQGVLLENSRAIFATLLRIRTKLKEKFPKKTP